MNSLDSRDSRVTEGPGAPDNPPLRQKLSTGEVESPHGLEVSHKRRRVITPTRTAGRVRIINGYGRVNESAAVLVHAYALDLALVNTELPGASLSMAFAGRNLENLTLGLLRAMGPETRARVLAGVA